MSSDNQATYVAGVASLLEAVDSTAAAGGDGIAEAVGAGLDGSGLGGGGGRGQGEEGHGDGGNGDLGEVHFEKEVGGGG